MWMLSQWLLYLSRVNVCFASFYTHFYVCFSVFLLLILSVFIYMRLFIFLCHGAATAPASDDDDDAVVCGAILTHFLLPLLLTTTIIIRQTIIITIIIGIKCRFPNDAMLLMWYVFVVCVVIIIITKPNLTFHSFIHRFYKTQKRKNVEKRSSNFHSYCVNRHTNISAKEEERKRCFFPCVMMILSFFSSSFFCFLAVCLACLTCNQYAAHWR